MSKATSSMQENVRFDDAAPGVARIGLIVGGAALLLSLGLAFSVGREVFFRSYILNFSFVMLTALGGLFFVLLQYATSSGWSVVVRRLAEALAATIPYLAILFVPILIPVLMGMKEIYPWANADVIKDDALLRGKTAYLDKTFFLIRAALYFGMWMLLAGYYRRLSVAQDETGDPELSQKMKSRSFLALVAYALTLTLFAIDVLKSLNPSWFSTMWAVYIFAGSTMSAFAAMILMAYLLQRSGRVTHSISIEHYHDLGKLAFAFVVFWTYIAFSQFMLIWYGNIPEETVFFLQRQKDTWWIGLSIFLLVGQFVLPFLGMMSREVKRKKSLLFIFAIWLLVMRWIDLYYLVIPRPFTPEGQKPYGTEPTVWIQTTDITLLIAMGGLFIGLVAMQLGKAALIPQRDPRLAESLAFENY